MSHCMSNHTLNQSAGELPTIYNQKRASHQPPMKVSNLLGAQSVNNSQHYNQREHRKAVNEWSLLQKY